MLKKLFIALGIATLVVVAESFISGSYHPGEEKSPVHWYTFTEAVELQKKKPRPIMVDIYTKWCGPCKMMSANTFGNEIIAKYLNANYYPVKFDAETYDSVKFNGYVFANKNPQGTPRPVHDFAISILDGKLSYPSIVFLNEEVKKIHTLVGYYKADQFEPIMKFIGSGVYKDTTVKWDNWQKTFVSELQPAERPTPPGQ